MQGTGNPKYAFKAKLDTSQESLAEIEDPEGEEQRGNEDKDGSAAEKSPLPELKEVDPFASSAPTGLVETERDRLIRLVRPLKSKLSILSQRSCHFNSNKIHILIETNMCMSKMCRVLLLVWRLLCSTGFCWDSNQSLPPSRLKDAEITVMLLCGIWHVNRLN